MKNFKLIPLFFALLGLIASDIVLARGGHGHKSQAGGGHHHFGGGHRHFGGGHRHFRGGHRHFGGGHRHRRFNFGFSLGYFNPGYYYGYRPYYGAPFYGYSSYYPRALVAPRAPLVYIQREEPVQPQTNYWYYCRNPEGYYPYVKKCSEGWLQVAPRPAQ